MEFNNNGSDDIINSEKEKSSNNNSNDVDDTYDDNKEKQTKENYQFTDRNNEEFNNDNTDTQSEHSIEEIDKEISKNNDIIYNIQENIGLSNEMEVNSLSNENRDLDENDTYTSKTDNNLNLVNRKINKEQNQKEEILESDHNQQNTLLFKEDNELFRKSYSKASSLNTSSVKSRPMMLPSDEVSTINSMNLPEEVANTPKISERNLQAMKILYRIRDKLNGYDSQIDQNTMDVTKHVDKIINQAINIDNLACMYEGWTSWI